MAPRKTSERASATPKPNKKSSPGARSDSSSRDPGPYPADDDFVAGQAEIPVANKRRSNGLGRPRDVASLALVNETTRDIYHECYREIFVKERALDRKTKELIAIAASTVSGCQGCLNGHLRKARALGVPAEQIKEAVAVAFAVNAATVVDRTDVAAAMLKLEDEDE